MLIKCPECGKQVSDKADKCPGCGYLLNKSKNNARLRKIVIVLNVVLGSFGFLMLMSVFQSNGGVKENTIPFWIALNLMGSSALCYGAFKYPNKFWAYVLGGIYILVTLGCAKGAQLVQAYLVVEIAVAITGICTVKYLKEGCSYTNSEKIAVVSMICGIIGLLTTCIGVGGLLCVAGLILGVIALAKNKPGTGYAVTGVITSTVGVIIFFIIGLMVFSGSTESANTEYETVINNETTIAVESEKQTPEETTIEVTTVEETTTIEETTAAESEEEFKASCEEIGYKKLLRTSEDYIGKRIVITAEVKQVMSGGWFDDGKYYRVQTDNDGYEYYMDDEYFMYDNRTDDMKILTDDVLKIYAEFIGLEEVRRALTGAKEEVPAIKAYYVELISE